MFLKGAIKREKSKTPFERVGARSAPSGRAAQVMGLFRALDQEATMREEEEAQLQQCRSRGLHTCRKVLLTGWSESSPFGGEEDVSASSSVQDTLRRFGESI